jgi:hypothetical protein
MMQPRVMSNLRKKTANGFNDPFEFIPDKDRYGGTIILKCHSVAVVSIVFNSIKVRTLRKGIYQNLSLPSLARLELKSRR